jgi:hypothetical protein
MFLMIMMSAAPCQQQPASACKTPPAILLLYCGGSLLPVTLQTLSLDCDADAVAAHRVQQRFD